MDENATLPGESREALIARIEELRIRATNAETHSTRLEDAIIQLRQEVAESGQRARNLTEQLRREVAESGQRTRDLIRHLWTRLETRLRHVYQASAEETAEFRDLLQDIKVTSGSTQPSISHQVILATTENTDATVKYQLHTGSNRYIAQVSHMYRDRPNTRVSRLGDQGNGVSMRRYIREKAEPRLEALLGNDAANRVSLSSISIHLLD